MKTSDKSRRKTLSLPDTDDIRLQAELVDLRIMLLDSSMAIKYVCYKLEELSNNNIFYMIITWLTGKGDCLYYAVMFCFFI